MEIDIRGHLCKDIAVPIFRQSAYRHTQFHNVLGCQLVIGLHWWRSEFARTNHKLALKVYCVFGCCPWVFHLLVRGAW